MYALHSPLKTNTLWQKSKEGASEWDYLRKKIVTKTYDKEK